MCWSCWTAGIDVMTAVNVQHLETLNDAVARSANTTIRETVPDSLLKRADEVVNVDLTVEELRSRLKQGKIYAPEKIEQSLANFFRKGNLNLLRELALRTTAAEVSSQAADYRRSQGLEQAPIPEKVMVCLSPRPARTGCCAPARGLPHGFRRSGMRCAWRHRKRQSIRIRKRSTGWRSTSGWRATWARR